MADEERGGLESMALQRNTWAIEETLCIDDTIDRLTAGTADNKTAREIIVRAQNKPEGENFEQDIGYIQCEPPRRDLVDLLKRIKRVPEVFGGHVYRDIALLCTVMVDFGTIKIEEMLKSRKEHTLKDFKDWWKKEDSYSIEGYKWKALRPVEKGQISYKYNFFILDPTIRARLHSIKDEYDISLTLLVQMAIVEAARTSRLIPSWLKELLDEEHYSFEKWLDLKTAVDLMQSPKDLPYEEAQ